MSTFPILRCYHCMSARLPGLQGPASPLRLATAYQKLSQADGPLTTFCLSQNAQPFFPNDKPRDSVRRERALGSEQTLRSARDAFPSRHFFCLIFSSHYHPLVVVISSSRQIVRRKSAYLDDVERRCPTFPLRFPLLVLVLNLAKSQPSALASPTPSSPLRQHISWHFPLMFPVLILARSIHPHTPTM